jgi:hypothetical protein
VRLGSMESRMLGRIPLHSWPVFVVSLSAVLAGVCALALGWLTLVALRTLFM